MDQFRYRHGELYCEEVPVERIVREVGTPVYVYSLQTVVDHYRKIVTAFEPAAPLVCYSIKANSCLALLKILHERGCGFDVVSGGELYRALRVGADPKRIVFAGVGKSDAEIREGLAAGILMFNAESWEEIANIDRIAGSEGRRADVAVRINPDVDPETHTYIATGKKESKFGVDLVYARRILSELRALKNVRLIGIHVHIGSQITKVEPYVEALGKVADFIEEVRAGGHTVEWLDMGGGFGIYYKDKTARPAAEIAQALLPVIQRTRCKLALEPGRFIVGNAGILVTRVVYRKPSGERMFAICDAGMNALIRPTLYGAYHGIWPVRTDPTVEGERPDEETWKGPAQPTDVVGPICESGDFLAKERRLPPLSPGDHLAVFSAGAYGYVMASVYNSHPRPAEVLVDGDRYRVVTRRESYDELIRLEMP